MLIRTAPSGNVAFYFRGKKSTVIKHVAKKNSYENFPAKKFYMGGGHNGQKVNKLGTLHMCVFKIGSLNFKMANHSITGKKL